MQIANPWLARPEGAAQRLLVDGRAEVAMEDFMKACGACGPLELVVENRGLTAIRWSAHQPFALIGRDPAADLSLDHPRIDGHHIYLQLIEGGVYWVDLGSQSGTRRETGTARSGWLSYPEGIGIGPYVIHQAAEYREEPVPNPGRRERFSPFASRPQDFDDLPRVVLEFSRELAKPIRWRMRHTLTLVGRSTHCKVRLAAPGVSPFHCSLLRTYNGLWMVNLLGQGGVTVNGLNVRAARLDHGDELRVGDVLIRVFFKTSLAIGGDSESFVDKDCEKSPILTHPVMTSRELATSPTKANWMAPGLEAGSLLTERVAVDGELSVSTLAYVFDQFGQMQQEFFEQFQQTTVMMFRALSAMQHEQMKELCDKLDSLHQISETLQEFQAKLGTNVESAGVLPAERKVDSPSPKFGLDSSSGPMTIEVANDSSLTSSPLREPHSSNADNTEEIRAKLRSMVDQSDNLGVNAHEWLIDRIATIEAEQRTRWQRILDLMRRR